MKFGGQVFGPKIYACCGKEIPRLKIPGERFSGQLGLKQSRQSRKVCQEFDVKLLAKKNKAEHAVQS